MSEYRDFNYVTYILESEFSKGYRLFLESRKREEKKRYWDLFLVDRLCGYNGSFEDYYKGNRSKAEQKTMTYEEKDKEEKRITQKVENIDFSKMKKRKVLL